MKANRTYQGVLAAVGVCLALAACSSGQKPANLDPVAGGSTGTTAGAATGASSGASSSSASSAASSSSAAPAPATSTVANGGQSLTLKFPADANGVAAMTAYQNFSTLVYNMGLKAEHSNDLVNYADGNVLSLTNDFITTLHADGLVEKGTVSYVASVTNINVNAKPLPMVSITVCADATKLNTYFVSGAKKGQAAGAPNTAKTLAVYGVHKSADGKWRVNSVTPQQGKTC